MFDAYLLEGYRVLMRYALALMKSYKKLIKTNAFANADEFWLTIQRNAKNEERSLLFPSCLNNNNSSCNDSNNTSSNYIALYKCSEIHINAYENERSIVGKAYRPMNISNQKLTEINSRFRDNASPVSLRCFGETTNMKKDTNEEIKTSLVYINNNDTMKLANNSSILSPSTADRLLRILPATSAIDGLALVFTSKNDGWDISYLYNKLNGVKGPFIIVLNAKTKTASIIGVYITADISPDTKSKGTGESFIFRLDDDHEKKYQWIGLQSAADSSTTSNISHSIVTQFATFNNDYMSFGASDKHGTNAIYISSNLCTCATGVSDTYHNPPLVSIDECLPSSLSSSSSTSISFDIKDIEVYSLVSNYNKAVTMGRFQKQTSILAD